MIRFKRWAEGRRMLGLRSKVDNRPYWEATFVFQAADMDEADCLFEKMADGLGCGDDCDHVCPHFRVGGVHRMEPA